MASKSDILLKECSDQLTCPICLETLNTPKTLECQHVFCMGCLDKWINENKAKREDQQPECYPCPVCKVDYNVPKNGSKSYKTNFLLSSLIDVLQRVEKLKTDEPIYCDVCLEDGEKSTVICRCIECAENLCQTCSTVHKRSKLSRSHELLEVAGEDGGKSEAMLASLKKSQMLCKAHPGEALKFYCQQDKVVVCRDCCITKHSNHTCVALTEITEKHVENLNTLMTFAKNKINKYDESKNRIDEFKMKANEGAKKEIDELKKDRDMRLKQVSDYFDGLDKELKASHEEIMKHLQDQQNQLEIDKGVSEGTLANLSTMIQHGHPVEIANSNPDIMDRIQKWSHTTKVKPKPEHKIYRSGTLDVKTLGKVGYSIQLKAEEIQERRQLEMQTKREDCIIL
ncbi:unnamed protein product [Owenia fusiformis]|uniref:Uncharacterized protein n=1 Tax=Owenia fusiformis TaxID=6347 RepID=A0A8J1TXT0_OWEFU|nr:unnamed protein product [Owenia fusiformis]